MSWIKLDRDITFHWIWKDPVKLKWWLDLLLTVNYIDNKVNICNKLFECKRGQSIMSLQNWSIRWNTSKDSVRNFFLLLEKDKMILIENLVKTTRITICNYELYQSDLHDTQTIPKRKPNAIKTQPHTIEERKKDKKGKKDKKEFIKPSIEEVKQYFKENRFKEEVAIKMFNSYDVADWIDSKGNQIKNWKQKAINVWFKDENKTENKQTKKFTYEELRLKEN
jgi:hypothetical protein